MTKKPWFPTINTDACDGCKGTFKCVNFCPYEVFMVRGNEVVVIQPLKCIYGCSTCASLCPQDAIMFPSRQESARSVKKKSLLQRVSCEGCGKQFLTGRETNYCFDCER